MPDKLTDNEIIKALEIYIACYGREIRVTDNVGIGNIYDLINRQQAEKQDLEIELKAMRGAANSYKAENERLKEALRVQGERLVGERGQKYEQIDIIIDLKKQLAEAKAEAYKEFWKGLYVEMRMYGQQEKFTKSVFLSVAHKVLKELVGDT